MSVACFWHLTQVHRDKSWCYDCKTWNYWCKFNVWKLPDCKSTKLLWHNVNVFSLSLRSWFVFYFKITIFDAVEQLSLKWNWPLHISRSDCRCVFMFRFLFIKNIAFSLLVLVSLYTLLYFYLNYFWFSCVVWLKPLKYFFFKSLSVHGVGGNL